MFLKKEHYRYHLPEELIAQYPPKERDHCRLMHLCRESGDVSHEIFHDIVNSLRKGDLLVLNTSRVIPARLRGRKKTGAFVEVLLLREIENNIWECLVRPGNRIKKDTIIDFSKKINGKVLGHLDEGIRVIEFNHNDDFWEILDEIGEMPLPPYIKRTANREDFLTYQTIYAKEWGSAAAPTAGLHFTTEILEELKRKGILLTNIILHIGLDTFRPVKVNNILEHKMHREFCTIPLESAHLINRAKMEQRRVIAVGTTTVRTLESFNSEKEEGNDDFAFVQAGSKWTDIFIYPGFEFRIVDGLVTNFHLPESTLIMMVAAFAGYDNIMKAYNIAVQEQYRFFSYGDAMLIL